MLSSWIWKSCLGMSEGWMTRINGFVCVICLNYGRLMLSIFVCVLKACFLCAMDRRHVNLLVTCMPLSCFFLCRLKWILFIPLLGPWRTWFGVVLNHLLSCGSIDSYFALPYPWWVSPESPWCWNFYPLTSQSSKICIEKKMIRLRPCLSYLGWPDLPDLWWVCCGFMN